MNYNISVDLINNNSKTSVLNIEQNENAIFDFSFNASTFKKKIKLTIKTPNKKYFIYDIINNQFRLPDEVIRDLGQYTCTLELFSNGERRSIKPFYYTVIRERKVEDEVTKAVSTLKKEIHGLSNSRTTFTTNSWYDGSGIPSDDFGDDDDYYLNLSNGDIYKKIFGIWERQGCIMGPIGPQGEPGKVGPAGPQGEQGPSGPRGEKGNTTQWYDGAGIPVIELGEEGDYYLDISTFDIYKKKKTHWERIGNISNGSSNSTGGNCSATKWYDGAGVPNMQIGQVGDYYLNTKNYDIYKKTETHWERIGNISGGGTSVSPPLDIEELDISDLVDKLKPYFLGSSEYEYLESNIENLYNYNNDIADAIEGVFEGDEEIPSPFVEKLLDELRPYIITSAEYEALEHKIEVLFNEIEELKKNGVVIPPPPEQEIERKVVVNGLDAIGDKYKYLLKGMSAEDIKKYLLFNSGESENILKRGDK